MFTRTKTNSIYDTDNPLRIKHFIKLMGGISHQKERTFRRSFQDSVAPMYKGSKELSYFLNCTYNNLQRLTLYHNIKNANEKLMIRIPKTRR